MPENTKKLIKDILVVFLIVAVALGIELVGFNYHSVVKGETIEILYQPGEAIPEGLKRVREDGTGTRLVLNECTYIKKMKVLLDVPQKIDYTVYTRYDNMFGAEENGQVIDAYWPELGAGYTNLGRKLKALTIVLPKDTPAHVKSILLYTKTAVNRDRVLFFCIVFFFLYIFIFKNRIFTKYLEWTVAGSCLILGCFGIFSQGLLENGWDEQIHFRTVYQLSYGTSDVRVNDTYRLMSERLPKDIYNTVEEKELLTQYLNDKYYSNEEMVKNEIKISYKQAGYFLQVMAVWIGRILHLSFNKLYMLGKFVNLITYIFVLFWAMRLMPQRKELIAVLSLIPTQVFIASTYTYDVTVGTFLILGVVLWLKVVLEEKTRKTDFYLIGSVLAFVVGSLSKAVYIPIIILCYFIPKEKFEDKRRYYGFLAMITAGLIVVMMSFILPAVSNTLNNQVGVMGDARGGNTDVVLQMKSILKHPLQYIYLFFREVIQNFGRYFVGHTGLAFFGRMNELNSRWIYVTIPWIFGVMFLQRDEDRLVIEKKYKLVLGFVILVILGLIWSAMYLDYTPVGAAEIRGVQARYYYPLMLPLMLICSNKICIIQIQKTHYRKLAIGVPILLMLAGIYGKIFVV